MTPLEAKVLLQRFTTVDVECIKYGRLTVRAMNLALEGLDGSRLDGSAKVPNSTIEHERILLAETLNSYLEAGRVLLDLETDTPEGT